jgi:GT2 family glycosyltransferase
MITICVLTFGDYPDLTRRAIGSILAHCPRSDYRLIVGANAVADETCSFLESIQQSGGIDHLIVSKRNINKCPMMRRMFKRVETELIWWFDDDSFILDPAAFDHWRRCAERASAQTVMWGKVAFCDHPSAFAAGLQDPVAFVRSADWYRGLTPPSWSLGGRGQFDYAGRGTGDGRWFFVLGGCWMIRTQAIRALDWPDRRLIRTGDDVFLGEAIRQQGWVCQNIEDPGVAIDTEPRRGSSGPFSELRADHYGARF